MIKVIASDMDGTLLNSKIQVDEEGVKAIEQARAKGIHFVLCTGRMYDDATQLINHANLYAPAICMNGAEIRDEHGKILKQIPIDTPSARYTYKVLEDLGMYCEFFTDIGPISPNKDKGIALMKDIQRKAHPNFTAEEVEQYVIERFESKDVHVIDDPERIFNNDEITILKFIAFSSDQAVLKQAKDTLESEGNLAISSSFSDNIEITHIDAQKGLSLQYYVERMGITMDETFAIGDNFNDVSMLKMAGYSVAMGNAEAPIKKLAKYQTDSNDEHGVATAIHKMLETNN
ncbi:Cof-type HAD-IIB family hydrolase [Listeria booriae]|uniref:Cof-type HAD-IIB family hydrolase n=1 Tax=Listeria booriae TaxID=1552123 RepID=UPI00162A99C8|nr:Cof-type HAD-IIB family hydrolase [Listeria booriae]MBC1983807.1 HAD family phosphatase [Listeria booriae]MBC2021141.1 HAD family phosphatase [Listeria booriae]MBC2047573.1 HAD family phosphatase [Listeria booriae]